MPKFRVFSFWRVDFERGNLSYRLLTKITGNRPKLMSWWLCVFCHFRIFIAYFREYCFVFCPATKCLRVFECIQSDFMAIWGLDLVYTSPWEPLTPITVAFRLANECYFWTKLENGQCALKETPSAKGQEVDKLSGSATKRHYFLHHEWIQIFLWPALC